MIMSFIVDNLKKRVLTYEFESIYAKACLIIYKKRLYNYINYAIYLLV